MQAAKLCKTSGRLKWQCLLADALINLTACSEGCKQTDHVWAPAGKGLWLYICSWALAFARQADAWVRGTNISYGKLEGIADLWSAASGLVLPRKQVFGRTYQTDIGTGEQQTCGL